MLLRRGLRAVAYDLRGHGRSAPAADGDYSLERFGEDLEALSWRRRWIRSAHARATVVGHSLGAMSIAAWADAHDVPAHANAAALINTGLGDLIAGHLLFGELAQPAESARGSGRALLGSRAPLLPVLLSAVARACPLRGVRSERQPGTTSPSTSGC